MGIFDEITTFVELSRKAKTAASLGNLLSDVLRSLGFDYYALGHHVDLQLSPSDAVQLVNYPMGWYEKIVEQRYYIDDPILALSLSTATAFAWSDLPKLYALNERQRAILEMAPLHGLGSGFTVPIHVPGEYIGSCHFGVKTGFDFPDSSMPAAQYVGCYAFEAARRIQLRPQARRRDVPQSLSPRQRDCIVLVARGLTDKEIARKLGISPGTVHEYVEAAKFRYGATKRNQLVARALFEGDVAFPEVLQPQSP